MRELVDLSPVLTELGERFTAAGFEAHLVGGSVRDALLGAPGRRRPGVPGDLDVTTDARPEQVLELLRGWASSTWNTGIAFGTVGRRGARRARWRSPPSGPTATTGSRATRRWPGATRWSTTCVRRDFTVNAMAVSLGPDRTVTDPFGGLGDLLARRLRTPGSAVDSFADDPLRMLRAVRFVAQLGSHAGRRGRRGDDVARRRAGPDHPRAGAGRAVEDAAAGRAPRGAGAVRRHRPGRRRPARAVRAADGDRRAPPAQGRLHPLADRAGPGDRAGEGGPGRGVAGPGAAAGRAAARHRQAGDAAARAARAGSPSTTTRWSGRSWCASG